MHQALEPVRSKVAEGTLPLIEGISTRRPHLPIHSVSVTESINGGYRAQINDWC
jgi:hypothetical protein